MIDATHPVITVRRLQQEWRKLGIIRKASGVYGLFQKENAMRFANDPNTPKPAPENPDEGDGGKGR